jgi:Lon protease-like protein
MRRDLPPRASLEHLKKQAKDLLEGHKRADPEALARIRDAVPAFAAMSDNAIAKASLALHDAQSAIAREYGMKSWVELRQAVSAQSPATGGPSDALIRALMPMPFPPEVGALLRDAATRRSAAATAAEAPLPATLPLIALRNALFVPRAVGPINVGRLTSRAAIDFALGRKPPTFAVFSQRVAEEEDPDAASLHPVGCEAYIHARLLDGVDRAWVVLEGVRWIALESVEPGPGGMRVARVKEVLREAGDPAEVGPLAESLRVHVRGLASAFPDAANLVARVDEAEPDRLADLVIANLPVSVDEKARYAAEPRLVERLRIASALSGLGQAGRGSP